jgi:hypothetical protein
VATHIGNSSNHAGTRCPQRCTSVNASAAPATSMPAVTRLPTTNGVARIRPGSVTPMSLPASQAVLIARYGSIAATVA